MELIVIGTQRCPKCEKVLDQLAEKGVEYTYWLYDSADYDKCQKLFDLMEEKPPRTAPVVVVNREIKAHGSCAAKWIRENL